MSEVKSAIDSGVGEQPGEVGGDEVQSADEDCDFIEELNGEELVLKAGCPIVSVVPGETET